MTKTLASLRFAMLVMLSAGTALALTGCELYFGDGKGNGDSWTYCASDGYYVCSGENNCEWASATCPDGTGPGFSCTSNTDCAAGCFCQSGTCEEAGFCSSDADCAEGMHCDDRSSCVPDTCASDAECAAGSVCDNGTCTPTCVCETDQQAIDGGFGYCDEARSTCMAGTDPAGSCGGAVSCNIKAPTCAEGEVPLIKDGCYTGSCRAIAQCDVTPDCGNLGHENDCLARSQGAGADCSAVYTGLNCTKPDGSACQAGDTGCTCQSFKFNSCTTRTSSKPSHSGKLVVASYGGYMSFDEMFH